MDNNKPARISFAVALLLLDGVTGGSTSEGGSVDRDGSTNDNSSTMALGHRKLEFPPEGQ